MARRRPERTTLDEVSKVVALYARVSTDEQRERGTVETQLEKLRGRARLEEWEVAGEYVDEGVSGTIPLEERPEGGRLVADARAGRFTTVLAYKLDRVGRKLQVIVDGLRLLEDLGVRLNSLTESIDTSTPAGRMMFHVLASVAEMERDVIYERTNGGRDRVAADTSKGCRWVTGPIPPGYDLDENSCLVVGADAERWVEVFNRVAWKQSSAVAEARRLTALGVPTTYRYPGGKTVRRASAWASSRLLDILHSPVYRGVSVFTLSDGTPCERPCPPLVDRETWDRAQQRLASNKRLPKNGAGRDYLLRGLIVCGNCGGSFTGWPHSSGETYYRCSRQVRSYLTEGAPRCEAKLLPVSDLETVVWERCRYIILHPDDAVAEAQKILRDQITPPTPDTAAERETIQRRIGEWHARRSRQQHLYREHLATLEETQAVIREADGAISLLEADLRLLIEPEELADRAETDLVAFAADVHQLAGRLDEIERVGDLRAKRLIVERLIDCVRSTTHGAGMAKWAEIEVSPHLGSPVQVAATSLPASRSAPAAPGGSGVYVPGSLRSGR